MKGDVALVRGLYFLVTALWPLASIGTFQRVTGPKVNFWLVNTVGVIVTEMGQYGSEVMPTNMATTSFASVRNEADRVRAAGVRPWRGD